VRLIQKIIGVDKGLQAVFLLTSGSVVGLKTKNLILAKNVISINVGAEAALQILDSRLLEHLGVARVDVLIQAVLQGIGEGLVGVETGGTLVGLGVAEGEGSDIGHLEVSQMFLLVWQFLKILVKHGTLFF
jgi:hypothetical protein